MDQNTKTITTDYRFKLIYAIAMTMVVAGHMTSGVNLTLNGWFPYLGLHLPLFMFASGYFFKDGAVANTGAYVLKKVKILLIPLYIYNLIYGIIKYVSRFIGFTIGNPLNLYNLTLAPITDGHHFEYNMGGWYVIPLFMVEVFYVLLRKLFSMKKNPLPEWVSFALCAAIGVAGNYLAYFGYNHGWWRVLVRFTYFVPFYALGVFYNRVLEKYESKIPGIVLFPVLFGAKLLLTLYYGKSLAYAPAWCEFKENGFIPLIVGILGIGVWMRIATILEPVLGRNKYVNLIADNTYSIMINQFAGFMVVKGVYAVISRFTPYMNDFDMNAFRSDIWYCYLPKGLSLAGIFYLIMGLVLPIGLQFLITKVKNAAVRQAA
jgi:fucose 4-O-acetylase-like acetyltransferase